MFNKKLEWALLTEEVTRRREDKELKEMLLSLAKELGYEYKSRAVKRLNRDCADPTKPLEEAVLEWGWEKTEPLKGVKVPEFMNWDYDDGWAEGYEQACYDMAMEDERTPKKSSKSEIELGLDCILDMINTTEKEILIAWTQKKKKAAVRQGFAKLRVRLEELIHLRRN